MEGKQNSLGETFQIKVCIGVDFFALAAFSLNSRNLCALHVMKLTFDFLCFLLCFFSPLVTVLFFHDVRENRFWGTLIGTASDLTVGASNLKHSDSLGSTEAEL